MRRMIEGEANEERGWSYFLSRRAVVVIWNPYRLGANAVGTRLSWRWPWVQFRRWPITMVRV